MIDELANMYSFYYEGVLDFNTDVPENKAIPIINEVFDAFGIEPIEKLSDINEIDNNYIYIRYKEINGKISITFHINNHSSKSAREIMDDIEDIINEYMSFIYYFDMSIYFMSEDPDIYLDKYSIEKMYKEDN